MKGLAYQGQLKIERGASNKLPQPITVWTSWKPLNRAYSL